MRTSIAISDVQIGPRHRKDNGDLDELAESIRSEGLFQPIGVNGSNALVFGMRRLLACRDVLQWTHISCRVVNVSSMLAGEVAENEVRKSFTLSERDSIRRAIEEEIGNRQGERTDKIDGEAQLVGNCPQVPPAGEKTRDFSARKAGFKSTDEARRVRTVVNNGAPELVEAMDKGEISESAAAKLAALPKNEQKAAIKDRGRKNDAKPTIPKPMRLTNRALANATLSQKVAAMRDDIAAGTRPLEVHAHYGVSRSEYAKLRVAVESGNRDLIDALDSGLLSVGSVYSVSKKGDAEIAKAIEAARLAETQKHMKPLSRGEKTTAEFFADVLGRTWVVFRGIEEKYKINSKCIPPKGQKRDEMRRLCHDVKVVVERLVERIEEVLSQCQ